MVPPDMALSAGQVSGTTRREPPKCEWTCRMIALTCDFHVSAPRVTTAFSAVFFSICYITQARYVCALFHLFIRHYDSILIQVTSPTALRLLTYPVCCINQSDFGELTHSS